MIDGVPAADSVLWVARYAHTVKDGAQLGAPVLEVSSDGAPLDYVGVFVEVGEVAFEGYVDGGFHFQTGAHGFEGSTPIVEL